LADLILRGSEFHNSGAAQEKALLPYDLRLKTGLDNKF
jgi:hypothetical protein